MRKKDLILITVFLATAAVMYLIFYFRGNGSASYAVVRVDGKETARYLLVRDAEEDIDTQYGHNHISIKDGVVKMTEADCPDGYCMEQKPVGDGGGQIICLPHHLVVETEGKHAREDAAPSESVDTVAK